MDPSGSWRPPEEWPEDTAPFDGWIRGGDGLWIRPDDEAEHKPTPSGGAVRGRKTGTDKKLSRQARADRRAMLTVVGALGGAALLLIVALILITQAGATGNGAPEPSAEPEVIFEAETDQALRARQRSVAAVAPQVAAEQLAALEVRDGVGENPSAFDASAWEFEATDCVDLAEQVLIARSSIDVTYADQLECVLDRGQWTDRYLGTTLNSVIEADVQLLVPTVVASESGADQWTAETRAAYTGDTDHPATQHIVGTNAGHNPREQSPDEWRPSNRSAWCAYAVDWVAVKARWEFSVSAAEFAALDEMLVSCGDADSDGADPNSMLIETIDPPSIELN